MWAWWALQLFFQPAGHPRAVCEAGPERPPAVGLFLPSAQPGHAPDPAGESGRKVGPAARGGLGQDRPLSRVRPICTPQGSPPTCTCRSASTRLSGTMPLTTTSRSRKPSGSRPRATWVIVSSSPAIHPHPAWSHLGGEALGSDLSPTWPTSARPPLTCGKLHVRLLLEAAARQGVAIQGISTLSGQSPVDGGDGDHKHPHQRPWTGWTQRLG